MVTAKGVGVLSAAVAVFVLARLTQVGWLYLLDGVLWGAILVSAALPWFGIAFLRARRRLEPQVFAKSLPGPSEGELVNIELSLESRALWPSFFLRMFYDCPLAAPASRRRRFFLARLGRSSHISMTSTVEAYQRGLYHLEPVVIESSAPFGLFRRRVQVLAPLSVLVYPQIYPLHRLPLLDDRQGTAVQAKKSRAGPEMLSSRHYVPGDPRRHIHWRNTARTSQVMVKEFEDPQDQTVCLFFDTAHVWGEGRETTLEYAVKIVASVADYSLRQGASVRVWGGDLHGATVVARRRPDVIGPDSDRGMRRDVGAAPTKDGSMSWPALLKSLALVAADKSSQPPFTNPQMTQMAQRELPFTKGGLDTPHPNPLPQGARGLGQILPFRKEGPGGISQALSQMPPGSNAIIVVSPADHQGRYAISRSAPTLGRLVVVTLEGFGEPQPASEILPHTVSPSGRGVPTRRDAPPGQALSNHWQQAHIRVVRCHQGRLAETLQALEH